MTSIYGLIFLAIPFLSSQLAEAKATPSTPLKFVFPKPSKSDYRFEEGDEVIVEWKPEVQLSEVFLNCTSGELQDDGTSSIARVEFLDVFSGVSYLPQLVRGEDEDRTCKFCAGPDPSNTCSGEFSVLKQTQSSYSKAWTSEGTSLIWTEEDDGEDHKDIDEHISEGDDEDIAEGDYEEDDMPVSESATPTGEFPLVFNVPSISSSPTFIFPTPQSTNPALQFGLNTTNSSASRPALYGEHNASVPTWTGSRPPKTSLPPYMSANTTDANRTVGVVIGSVSTTITAQIQGWNTSSTAASDTGNVLTTKTIPLPSDRIPTASLVPPPTSTVSKARGTGLSTVDLALFGLVVLGAVFVTL